MENLGRGIIAVRTSGDSVYIGWRLLGTEPEDIAFNIYRQSGNEKPVKLNKKPIIESTNFIDGSVNLLTDNAYYVRAVSRGKEQGTSKSFTLMANPPVQQYINIPLRTPAGYTPNDISVGDLDGDGEYELILHQTGRSIDTPSTGISGIPVFQAYKMNGTFLWEISLGRNIREGAHYTQFMVYDLDGDGISEFACKTADGTIDGIGKIIGDSTKEWRNLDKTSGPFYGKILDGPEYFTIFSGSNGEALATTNYIPDRYPLNGWNGHGGNGGGDSTGNRVDRMLACVAYLDGVHPSVVMCRGYYGRSVLAAWDWRDGRLTSRWVFDSKDGENPYSGQGNHNISVTDVDGDGRDEIIYGSMVVDDNGKGLFSTGFRHGDAIHVGEFISGRPGLQVFGIHEIENNTTGPGVTLFDARTGEVLFEGSMNRDVGRGVAADIDSANPGAEMWWSGSGGLFNMKGEKIGQMPSSTNFLVWWDGDLTRELLDGNHIDKYKAGRIFTAEGCVSNNGSKSTPALSGDLFGDWREEVIFRTTDNQNLRIYTTTIPTRYRIYTLMHDPQYRLAIATQNVGYNQPPNTSFFLGAGMKKVPIPEHSGNDLRTSFIHDSLKRTFHIYIPSSYDKTVKIPLVIALHGRGATGAGMIILTKKGFNKLADQDGFIMVYPDGIELNWNDGRIDEEAKDRAHRENIDDVGFISALIDSMIKNYNINPKLVYVTGISNGAIMSYRLACELSNKITAIAPVDGNIPLVFLPDCTPSRPVSVLAINNTNDPLVPFEGGEINGKIRRIKLGKVLSVDESVGFWVKRNKCSVTPVIAEEPDRDPKDGTKVTTKQYINGIEGTEVILYAVDGGGHTWPGGFQYLPVWIIGKTCRDFDANEVIWSFFKKHSR